MRFDFIYALFVATAVAIPHGGAKKVNNLIGEYQCNVMANVHLGY